MRHVVSFGYLAHFAKLLRETKLAMYFSYEKTWQRLHSRGEVAEGTSPSNFILY